MIKRGGEIEGNNNRKAHMKDSVFTMVQHRMTIKSTSERFNLIPIGDVHRDAAGCDVDRWKEFLKKAKRENKPNTRYIGLGDFHDFAAWGDRRKIKNANLHASTIANLDRDAMKSCTKMLDELWFTKDQWIGFTQGNHDWVFTYEPDVPEGTSGTQYMAQRLGGEWLGNLSYIAIVCEIPRQNKTYRIDVVVSHGKAGGKLAGTTINQVDDLRRIFPIADIYIMGHDHKRGGWPESTLIVNSGNHGNMVLKQKRQMLCRSGSFLRGFVPNEESYLVKMLKSPSELGAISLDCGFSRSRKDGVDLIIQDIKVTA